MHRTQWQSAASSNVSRVSRGIAAARARLRGEGGFTLIEVLVAALIVVLIGGAVATGLIATGDFSGNQRKASQADEIAQQDQERMRGMSAKQLNGLNQTRTVTLDGVAYTVTSTGQFVSAASGAQSCTTSGTTADYLDVKSDVTWGTGARHIVEKSVITPAAGGTILAEVQDQNGSPLTGATLTATGPDTESGITNANGCVIFGSLEVGTYAVAASLTNYVDPNGNASATGTANANSSSTTIPTGSPYSLGQAGAVNVTFTSATADSAPQAASISWVNPAMTASAHYAPGALATSITSPKVLFPFISGGLNTYNNNYSVWAGSCDSDKPPSPSAVSVGPGGTPSVNVQLPGLIVKVTNKAVVGRNTVTSSVTPDHIKITDACGQAWYAQVSTAGPNAALGQLAHPAQPYAPTGAPLTVCADYKSHKASVTTANTSFAAAGTTAPTVAIDSTGSGISGLC
jgi:type II secretory pathway pseudopilin PulG